MASIRRKKPQYFCRNVPILVSKTLKKLGYVDRISSSLLFTYMPRSEINLIPSTNSFNNVSHKMPFLGLCVKN